MESILIIYYLLVVLAGPCQLFYLLIFQPQKRRLHDAYLHSGVACLGMVTHRQIIVYRGSLTGMERDREHKIRYAYKAPGTNTIIFKDWVDIFSYQKRSQSRILHGRLFAAVVLPGQPDSGVPNFLVQEPRGWFCAVLSYLVAIVVSLLSIFLFAALYAVFVLKNCDAAKVCYVNPASFVLSIVSMTAVGYGYALGIHRSSLKVVPGRVWMRQELPTPTQESISMEERRVLYERLNERQVPMAEVVTVLSANDETLSQAAADAGVTPLVAHPINGLDQVENDESEDKENGSSAAEARVIEIV